MHGIDTQIMRERYPRDACGFGNDTPLMRENVPKKCVEIFNSAGGLWTSL